MSKQTLFLFFCFICFVGAFLISKSRAKTQKNPWKIVSYYSVRGLDLSHHNGKIRYDGLDSLDFVFLKATEGVSIVDQDFDTHYKGFQKKKIALGVYHFFRFDTNGTAQANHFLNRIKGYKFHVPLVVDVEHYKNPKVSRQVVIQRLNEFMQTIKNKTGQKPIIYTNGHGYSEFVAKDFKHHTLWLSSTTNTKRPAEMNCTFWQFHINANLKGIKHQADLNVFRGSREEWKRYLKKNKPFTI